MAWFKTKGSGEIRAKIEESKAQLQGLEAQAAEAEDALGRALAEGEASSEKALGGLATLKAKADSLRAVIARMEGELAAQVDREEKERNRQAVAALAARFERAKAGLEGWRQKIRAAAKALKEAEEGFDSATGELREILAATGLSAAVGSLVPRGAALVAVNWMTNGDSDLQAIYAQVGMAIHGAQAQREAVA
jgi:chromosome segregation ATPase